MHDTILAVQACVLLCLPNNCTAVPGYVTPVCLCVCMVCVHGVCVHGVCMCLAKLRYCATEMMQLKTLCEHLGSNIPLKFISYYINIGDDIDCCCYMLHTYYCNSAGCIV